MIHLQFLGHIKESMGAERKELSWSPMNVGQLFALLLAEKSSGPAHGFTKYNTIVVVNEGEAFSASSQEDRQLSDEDRILLVPFSHGG